MSAKRLSNDTAGILFEDRRKFYLRENVTKELWPTVAPFTTIISNKGIMGGLPDPEYKMFEHRSGFINQSFNINGAPGVWAAGADNGLPGHLTTTATPIDVKNGFGDVAGAADYLIGLVFEAYSVAGVYKGVVTVHDVSSGDVTYRSLGNPRAADNIALALADNDRLECIGSAIGEGEVSPDSHSDDLQMVWNSCQIFRTSVEVTGTLHQAALRGYSKELARLRKEKSKEHKMQKERAFLHGQRAPGFGSGGASGDVGGTHTKNKSGNIVRTTMGLISAQYRYGSSDETSDDQGIFARAKGSYTYAKFIEDSEKVFHYIPNSGYKTAICGPSAYSFWSTVSSEGFHKSTVKLTLSDLQMDKLKFHFKWLETPHGIIKLVVSPALRGRYTNHMTIFDEDLIDYKQYRAMYYATNIKTENNYDGVKDEYFSDEGIGIQLIEAHKLFIFS